MDSVSPALVARSEAVTTVFQPGMGVYLRRRIAGMDKIVLARCVSAAGGRVVMQWPEAGTAGSPPHDGEEITCQTLMQGVLYVAKGQVEDVAAGKQPRLRIHTGERCIAVPLRKWPRYQASALLRMCGENTAESLCQASYCSMNISLGGFGVELPLGSWTGGDAVTFTVELLVERNGQADPDLPGVTVEGQGTIRRRQDDAARNVTYIGVRFDEIAADQMEALEFWLAAHNSFLRAV